jgi:2-polyprenyl-6-methoxyphenol hydroxylase-like FAD-dependent oxidoreductase
MPGPNPHPRVNRIVGQGIRILDHRGLYSVLTGTAEPPKPAPRSMFAGFALDLAVVPESQLFVVPVQQRGLVRVLAERAGEYDVDIRRGHVVTGFDQHDDGVTVHVAALDGAYDLTAKYLVGADGGTSQTRHLAGIEFPGMSSYDLVVRMGFDMLPTDEWVDPVSGTLHVPGSDGLPPLRFHRTERGVFACGAMGSRVVAMTYELDSSAREEHNDDVIDKLPMSLADPMAWEIALSQLPWGTSINPGSPPSTTELNRYRVSRRSLISCIALSGSAVTSKFSRMRAGLTDAVRTALPR